MTKAELTADIRRACGGGFITRKQLAEYFGRACPKSIDKYLDGLDRINGKYYFAGDVAESILKYRGA